MGEGEPGSDSVGESKRAYTADIREEEYTQEPADYGAVDPQPPVPNLEDAGERGVGIELVVGNYMVNPGPDKPERHDEEQGIEGQSRIVPLTRKLAGGDPGRRSYSKGDEQPVVAKGEGPRLEEHRRRRARERE